MRRVCTAKALEKVLSERPWLKLTLTIPEGQLRLHRMSTVLNICEQALTKSERYEVLAKCEESDGEHSFYVVETADAWVKR